MTEIRNLGKSNQQHNHHSKDSTSIEVLSHRWEQKSGSGETKLETVIQCLKHGKKSGSASIIDEKDLRYINLKNQNLSELDLSGTDFTGATLKNVNFLKSNLKEANFIKAKLEHCEFLGADLTEVNLNESEANDTDFGAADLTGASCFNIQMKSSILSRAKLINADFRAANLKDTHILDADLTNAFFTRANLQNCDFQGSSVKGANFDYSDFRNADLKGLREYKKASWIGCDIREVVFHGAYLLRRHIIDENFLYEFRHQSKAHEFIYKTWLFTSDCGRSFSRWALFVLGLSIMFAALYSLVDIDYGEHSTAFSPFYFSIITISTLGYGDVTPVSMAGQILTVLEVIVGYCSLGGLLSIFTTKMGRRGE